jgi:hypothetical protein
VGWSVTTPCSTSRVYAPIHNLITYRQILFTDQDLEQICPLWHLAQILGELPFGQVILRLFLVSHILAQSTKTWWHCIIAFLHCTIPYASSHKCGYNLEQECKYLMQSWMYLIQPCCHRMLSLASSGLLLLELYLESHPLDLPCASHSLLAII